MNTNIIFIILILICIICLLQSQEQFTDTTTNYFIDNNGKHYIDKIPTTVNNIYELYIIHTSENSHDKITFVLTNGNLNTSQVTSKTFNIHNKLIHYQLLHLKSTTPFSGNLTIN